MNDSLTHQVTDVEIKQAIQNIGGDKAPGPDGMLGAFFHQFWPTVGPDIIVEVKIFFDDFVITPQLNQTHICLLPKSEQASRMSDYRPISLCNVIYKIISKIITNRLKTVMPLIISDQQYAFVPGRQITDNVLVAHELLHSLKSRK